MLRRFHVKNFRSCKNVVLEGLGSLTALVGRNGSGKTNLLQAIARLAHVAASTDLSARARRIIVRRDCGSSVGPGNASGTRPPAVPLN